MALLAKKLGIAVPSLYAHVEGLGDLQQQIAVIGLEALSETMGLAIQGRSELDALLAMADVYREFASKYPGRYAASQMPPTLSDQRHVSATSSCAKTINSTLGGYGLTEPSLTDAARLLRCTLHGFVSLEAVGGFAADRALTKSFKAMVRALDQTFRAWPARR